MNLNSAAQETGDFPAKVPARVMVVTGASGGHIFPAIAFLEKLKEKYGSMEALLVLPRPFRKAEKILECKPRELVNDSVTETIDNLGYKIKYVAISTIKLNFNLRNFVAVFNFFKGTLESIVLLIRFRPEVVVAFGSIVCVPAVFFAWIFRIKTMLHEQNVIPGRANRFLAKIADRIAVSFSESRSFLNSAANRLVVTGNPLRASLKQINKNEALGFFGLSGEKFTILVAGGSQGSHKVNLCFQQAFSTSSAKEKSQVIHLSGIRDYDLLKETYRDFRESVRLFDFFKDMQYAYSAADLVISRAGATTISELILFRLPAIIIPYPYAYQHQLANAHILERLGAAIIIEERALDIVRLKETLERLLNNRTKLSNMRSGYERLGMPQAAEKLVESALTLY